MFYFLFFYSLDNQKFYERKSFTTNQNYLINSCHFLNILNNEGGGLYISITSNKIEVSYCLFNNTFSSNNGGGCYLFSNSIFINFTCFNYCKTNSYGAGTFMYCTLNNSLSYSSFNLNVASIGAWVLRGGFSKSIFTNNTLCKSSGRESVGHFTYGPNCYSNKNNFISNSGPYIYYPYTVNTYSNHENSNFFNNSVSKSLFYFAHQNTKILNFIFNKNIGTISGGDSGYVVDFENCIFDTGFSGSVRSTINCLFFISNPSTIQINHNIWCNNYLLKSKNRKILNFKIINLIFFPFLKLIIFYFFFFKNFFF